MNSENTGRIMVNGYQSDDAQTAEVVHAAIQEVVWLLEEDDSILLAVLETYYGEGSNDAVDKYLSAGEEREDA
jgi:hypothetical protein